jgi:hypothetical protein
MSCISRRTLLICGEKGRGGEGRRGGGEGRRGGEEGILRYQMLSVDTSNK